MKQFMLLKVLFVPVFFITSFSAFAMDKRRKLKIRRRFLNYQTSTFKGGVGEHVKNLHRDGKGKYHDHNVVSPMTFYCKDKKDKGKRKHYHSEYYNINKIKEYKTKLQTKYGVPYSLYDLLKENVICISGQFIPGSVLQKLVADLICWDTDLVNKVFTNGRKPLEQLASCGNTGMHPVGSKEYLLFEQRTKEMAKLLFQYGANPDATNKEGKTAYCIAKEQLKLGYATKVFADIFISKPRPK